MQIDRREFLAAGAAALGAAVAPSLLAACVVADDDAERAGAKVGSRPRRGRFTHGVASSDPGPDSVVLWARVVPQDPALEPGTTYYYRFETEDGSSPVGRTRTLPAPGGVELSCGSVTSPGGIDLLLADHHRFSNGLVRSYLLLEVATELARADWFGFPDPERERPTPPVERWLGGFTTEAGANHLVTAPAPTGATPTGATPGSGG